MRRSDPLILGAGPAGATAALCLARADARPLIIERDRETGDALCGGFISWRTRETLARLGVTDIGGHPIDRLRVISGTTSVEAPLPRAAIGLSRQRLDSALLAAALTAGAGIERGTAVRGIEAGGRVRLADGSELVADSLFLATGKHDVRGAKRPHDKAPMLGLRRRLAPHPALTRMIGPTIELHLFPGGYCGLLVNERGETNVCMAINKARLGAVGGDVEQLLAQLGTENPRLGERLAFDGPSGFDAISAIPYGWIANDSSAGLFRLGDQAAVIPSLAGEGTGMAIASGLMAAQNWQAGGAAAAPMYQQRFAATVATPVRMAGWLWRLSEFRSGRRLGMALIAAAPAIASRLAEATRIR